MPILVLAHTEKWTGGFVTFSAGADHDQGQGRPLAPHHLCHGTEEQC